MASFLAVPPQDVILHASTGNNAMPQCSFSSRDAGNERVEITANDDTAPQPYFVLERTAIEAAQQFTPGRLVAPPQAVAGLGLEADWFPAETQLMATDGIRLIAVSVSWRAATPARKRTLAEVLARTYLKVTKPGSSRANGYP